MDKFDTHRFLFTLNYNGGIKGHKVVYLDKNETEITLDLEKIEIGASPVSCKLYDKQGKRYAVPFIRIRKVFLGDELVWDNTETDLSNTKIIKGYK